jgi:DNA-binding NarL/FixJ family response regulator
MSHRILIVDDSPVIRRSVRSWIELKTDWKVCGEAGDGETAVQLVRRLKPDVVILDLAMPGLNGLQASREIAALAPRTRMVLLTNFPSKLLEDYARTAGIRAVLAKDGEATLDRLISTIKALPDAA